MKGTWLGLGLLTALSVNTWSAERFEVIESIDVNAGADKAWEVVKDFGGLHNWHPAVTKTEITEGELPLRGAMRVLTIGDGDGSITETLTAYSDEDMKLSYVINATDIIPVKDYASTVNVVPISDNLSLVIWSGDFLANPPEGQEDAMSRDTIVNIYRAGLDNLKSMLEQ